MERSAMLGNLVKEVLGPRDGFREKMSLREEPKDEYIVGVLAPKNSYSGRDVDVDADLTDGDYDPDVEESEDGSEAGVIAGACCSPTLDPKSLPKSLGISFVVAAGTGISLQICSTWARYRVEDDFWVRHPFYDLKEIKKLQDDHWGSMSDQGVEFSIRCVPLPNGTYRISVFLVNNTSLHGRERHVTEDCVFQPEIRVKCVTGCKVVPIDGFSNYPNLNDPEIQENLALEMLYLNRPALARGHLVGATWKEIDPQRPHSGIKSPKYHPFYWTDSSIVPFPARQLFFNCDVRTDYIPTYPIEAPSMKWRPQYGIEPQFNPRELAKCWTSGEIRGALDPLVDGYKKWLADQHRVASALHPRFSAVASAHLNEIQASIERMITSVNLLCNDQDVRLAFCFANEVMARQSQWAYKQVYPWRPFQLAFILQNISAIAVDTDPHRKTADLLWFATGGGKTESYLGLAAFTLALQRRRAQMDRTGHRKGSGVDVLSRYTLRLLTIQQFRRALRVVTAAEVLRVEGLGKPNSKIGWRPAKSKITEDFIWGSERFSIGLWVGGGVTPNSLHSLRVPDENGQWHHFPGALELLKQPQKEKKGGAPAQVITCPCCKSYVAIPNEGLGPGNHTIHFLFKGNGVNCPNQASLTIAGVKGISLSLATHANPVYHTLTMSFTVEAGQRLKSETIDSAWNDTLEKILGSNIKLQAARPTRPGYFIRTFFNQSGSQKEYGFDVICPNPECELNQSVWAEKVPICVSGQCISANTDMEYQSVLPQFQVAGSPNSSSRIIIPAYTTDDQIYHRCPSMVIATADKFAQLPYEPKASPMFGNVEYYHARWGYYRENCPPNDGGSLPTSLKAHPSGFQAGVPLHKRVNAFTPPLLIIQDELHLIEGPLGSLFGLYETVIDELCTTYSGANPIPPKYIASTATVRKAGKQVESLFARSLAQFPPPGIDIKDNFFSVSEETHPMENANAGRLYVGICAPGKGAQTPLVRIWSSLLQSAEELRNAGHSDRLVDGFWTLVGYFNAIRELAGAAALYRQDIRERMKTRYPTNCRTLSESALELSGRKDSMELPSLLEQLDVSLMAGIPEDAVLATSMFGTGVDVNRLRLMVVNGQPKSTSSYIQATGRVGRNEGGLVVSFFRASRPRDLDHYEFFTGYHRSLYKYVEPVTVFPFSPRAREKAMGPLGVALLRHASSIMGVPVPVQWRHQQKLQGQAYASAAPYMSNARHSPEIDRLIKLFEDRLKRQPAGRNPAVAKVLAEIRSELDKWYMLAQSRHNLLFNETSMLRAPQNPVVLGDFQHYFRNLERAFENSPQSLRNVEGTTTFKV